MKPYFHGYQQRLNHHATDVKGRRGTTCRLLTASGDAIVGEGSAFCSRKDKFRRPEGTAYATARAIVDGVERGTLVLSDAMHLIANGVAGRTLTVDAGLDAARRLVRMADVGARPEVGKLIQRLDHVKKSVF